MKDEEDIYFEDKYLVDEFETIRWDWHHFLDNQQIVACIHRLLIQYWKDSMY